MVIDEEQQDLILFQMHTGAENPQSFTASTIGGHVSINKTVERISSRFYWPDITGAVM